MEKAVDQHYKKVAGNFDEYFGKGNEECCIPAIIKKLQLKADDHLLDLGSGTGMIPASLRKSASLKYPITCVEPCESFHDLISKNEGLEVVANTAEGFCEEMWNKAKQGVQAPYNKVLLNAVIHHLRDAYSCLDNIIKSLPKDGILVFSERPSNGFPFPLLEEHSTYLRSLPMATNQVLPLLKSRSDVFVEVSNDETTYGINKRSYCDWIRSGFLSFFKDYTEEDLEDYVQRLDKEQFGGIGDEDDIVVKDTFLFTKCTKIC